MQYAREGNSRASFQSGAQPTPRHDCDYWIDASGPLAERALQVCVRATSGIKQRNPVRVRARRDAERWSSRRPRCV